MRGEGRRTAESVRSDVQTSTAARTTASMNSRSRSCPRRNARRIRASTSAGCARTQHPRAARLDAAAHATSFPHGSALTSLVSRRKPQHANRRCAVAPTDAEGRSLMCTDQPGLRTSAMPSSVPAQMWRWRAAQSRCRCVALVGPVPVQMAWGEPSPGADVAGVGPVPAQMWQGRTRCSPCDEFGSAATSCDRAAREKTMSHDFFATVQLQSLQQRHSDCGLPPCAALVLQHGGATGCAVSRSVQLRALASSERPHPEGDALRCAALRCAIQRSPPRRPCADNRTNEVCAAVQRGSNGYGGNGWQSGALSAQARMRVDEWAMPHERTPLRKVHRKPSSRRLVHHLSGCASSAVQRTTLQGH